MNIWQRFSLVSSFVCISVAAQAETKIRGYGSVVAGIGLTDDFDAEYADNYAFGYEDELSFLPDTLFALQLDSDMGEGLSATVQMVARANKNRRTCGQEVRIAGTCDPDKYNFEPRFEWAYLSYELTDASKLNFGRFRIPFYRYSDYLDVRYAYNWLKAPNPVYDLEFPSMDGLSYLYDFSVGDWSGSLQAVYGRMVTNNLAYGSAKESKLDEALGANLNLSWESFSFRLGYIQSGDATISSVDYSAASDGANQVVNVVLDTVWNAPISAGGRAQLEALTGQMLARPGLDSSALQEDILIEEDFAHFTAFGLGYDNGSLVIDAEWVKWAIEDTMLPNTEAYFVTFGWRFGNFLPTLTYSSRDGKVDRSVLDRIPVPQVAENVVPQINAYYESIIAAYSENVNSAVYDNIVSTVENALDENLWTLGVRYDFHASASLKISYDVRELETLTKDAKLFRIGVDFLF